MRSFPGIMRHSSILKPSKAICGRINRAAESRAIWSDWRASRAEGQATQQLLYPGIVRYYSSQFKFHPNSTLTREFGSHP